MSRLSLFLLLLLGGCAATVSGATPPPLMDRPLAERIRKSSFPDSYRTAAKEVGRNRWLTLPMTVCDSPTVTAQCDQQWPEGTKFKVDDVFENAVTGFSYYYHVTASDGWAGYIHDYELTGSLEKDPAAVAKRHDDVTPAETNSGRAGGGQSGASRSAPE
jgi:hypothetical protein